MVLCNTECVERISRYLDVPVAKLYLTENNILAVDNIIQNETVEGFSTIVQALAMNSNQRTVLGNNAITQALTVQWLEYVALCVNYADNSSIASRVLKELNSTFRSNTYISGTVRTIADLALYYALYSVMADLSIQEKATYVNVSRWFENIQQDKKIRQNLDLINFTAVSLYL